MCDVRAVLPLAGRNCGQVMTLPRSSLCSCCSVGVPIVAFPPFFPISPLRLLRRKRKGIAVERASGRDELWRHLRRRRRPPYPQGRRPTVRPSVFGLGVHSEAFILIECATFGFGGSGEEKERDVHLSPSFGKQPPPPPR